MTDTITIPVKVPTTPEEMINYLAYHILFHGLNFFDTDEYLDAEAEYASEDFSLEEYDSEDDNSRWQRHIDQLCWEAHLLLADQHIIAARALRTR